MTFPDGLQSEHDAAFAWVRHHRDEPFCLACEQAVKLSVEQGGITRESFLDLAARQEMSGMAWLYAMIGLCWGMEAQKAKREDLCKGGKRDNIE